MPVLSLTQELVDVWGISRHGNAPALIMGEQRLTYADLWERVQRRAEQFGPDRKLAVIELGRDIDSVTELLAAYAVGHPVLVVSPGDGHRSQQLLDHYRPNILTGDQLHPDLALLLSTSGSTGSPKLVRLSQENLTANAASIADYLRLTPADRAITTLPLHYCYGLSILHSHLFAGASVVLSDLSVADACFWRLAEEHQITSFAGVPYTFDLLDTAGFAERRPQSLRCITQAGGRLAPERVQEYAAQGAAQGWDFVVMYGQTEATARMAYLPPELAATRPSAIGRAIPGGQLSIAATELTDLPDDVGELVYEGPNVMMGYAETADDLANGRDVTQLRTGDLARQADDGLFEIVGRASRFAKVFGLRVDLGQVETALSEEGIHAAIVTEGERLWVVTDVRRSCARAALLTRELTGLPPVAVQSAYVETIPRGDSGKVDQAAVLARVHDLATPQIDVASSADDATAIRDTFATVLSRPDATLDDSFVDLRGDSLSFVEVSTRLSTTLGELPDQWHTLSARRLAQQVGQRTPVRRWWRPMDTSVVLRAVAIVAIVVSHVDLVGLEGGAHVLLALLGFNLARFAGLQRDRRTRVRALAATLTAIAIPTMVLVAVSRWLAQPYDWTAGVFLTPWLESSAWSDNWQLWFIAAAVWIVLGVTLLLAWPRADAWERRHRFGTALMVTAGLLAVRWVWCGVETQTPQTYAPAAVAWIVALGWLASVSATAWQRGVVSVLTVLGFLGFFGDGQREALAIIGVLVMTWLPRLWLPTALARVAGVLAAASLWIYLVHWQVYPSLEDAGHRWLALGAGLGAGVLAWAVVTRGQRWLARHRAAVRGVPRARLLPRP